MSVFGKTYRTDFLLRRCLKLKSAGVCEDITQQKLFFLHVHKFNCFLSLIQDSSLLCIILFRLPHNLLFFCPLCNFTPFLYSASNNPAARIHSHLLFFLHFISLSLLVPSPLVSSCHSASDGIIPVILSHYRSSDANGCTANPAADKPGPVPGSPRSARLCNSCASPCSAMPVMHRGS